MEEIGDAAEVDDLGLGGCREPADGVETRRRGGRLRGSGLASADEGHAVFSDGAPWLCARQEHDAEPQGCRRAGSRGEAMGALGDENAGDSQGGHDRHEQAGE